MLVDSKTPNIRNTSLLQTSVSSPLDKELSRRQRLIKHYKPTIWIIASVISILIIVGIFFVFKSASGPIPANIQSSVNFPLFYPAINQQTSIESNTIKYSKSNGQVSFIVNFKGNKLTFAEQGSPDSFSADPSFYSSLIGKLNGYQTFDTAEGRVDLTIPTETHEDTAVMNAKGTLLFVSSPNKLPEDTWKLLFNSLIYTQP